MCFLTVWPLERSFTNSHMLHKVTTKTIKK